MILIEQTMTAVGKSASFEMGLRRAAVVTIAAISGAATLERTSDNGMTWTPVFIGTTKAVFSEPGSFVIDEPNNGVQYRMSLDSGSNLKFKAEY